MRNLIKTFGIFGLATLMFACEKENITSENESNNNGTEIELRSRNVDHKVDICHTNGEMMNIDLNGAYSHLEHGDYLFSCNPSKGVNMNKISADIDRIVIKNGGDINKTSDRKKAFKEWYTDEYLTGVWTSETPSSGGSIGGNSGGIGGGSL